MDAQYSQDQMEWGDIAQATGNDLREKSPFIFFQQLLIENPASYTSVRARHDGTDGWITSGVTITLVNKKKILCVQFVNDYLDNGATFDLNCNEIL